MSTIVGREAELRAVERFLAALPAGPAALVLEGEAGIGKTAIWLAAVAAAEARSFRVLQARLAESEARLSYAALADLVGGAFDETRSTLPAPQELALATALLRAEADEPADARTTATALVGVLTALAAKSRVVVAIDDVPWLDAASARALEFAARRLPPGIGLLLTRRTDCESELPLGLGRALQEERVERVVPRPLSVGALHHLIGDRLGAPLARPTLVRLADASGGNPFFALELARAAARQGHRGLGNPLLVPASLQELVAGRVGALSPAAHEAVLVASALSRPAVGTVARALDADVDAALAEAEDAGVLVVEGEQLRFTHPLLASGLYTSATPSRRRRLHRRLADVVEDPEERARHLALSTTDPDEAGAAEIEAAARGVALRGAQNAAAELFEAASRLTPPERRDELVRRQLGEATALFAVGDAARARVLAGQAAASARQPELQARALLLHSEIVWAGGETDAPIEQLERALTAARGDGELEARVRARLVAFQMTIAPQRAVEHADAAIRLLHEDREPGLLAYVLINRFFTEALLGRGAQHDVLERGLALEHRAGTSATVSSIPLIWFHCIDAFDAARARHALEDRWYRDRGEEFWRAERLAHLAHVELRAGRWDVAEQYAEASWDRIAQFRTGGAWTAPHQVRALVDAHRGRFDRARATLAPQIERMNEAGNDWWLALALSGLAFVEFAAGDHAAADRALAQMRAATDALGFEDVLPDRSEPNEIESLVARDELDRARIVLARLEERGRMLPRPWIAATLPRSRALVLAAQGDVETALATLEAAPAVPELPFETARTLLVRGRLHRRLKQKRAAADALVEALGRFEQLGAPPWIAQTQGELDRVGLRPRAPDELTATERRVAELTASGMTNREVATAAFMSAKTVEANLARVYRKLGIRSRAELGAHLGRDATQT